MKEGRYHAVFWAMGGLLLSQASVFSGVSPLGTSVVLACGRHNLYTVLGAMVGAALIHDGLNKLLYFACMAVSLVFCLVFELSAKSKSLLAAVILGFGRGCLLWFLGDIYIWPELIFTDSLLGALYTWAFDTMYTEYLNGSLRRGAQNEIAAAVSLSAIAFVPNLFWGEVPLSLFVAVLCTLFFSKKTPCMDAALTGSCFGVCLSLMTGNAVYIAQLTFGAVAANTVQGRGRRAVAFSCAFLAGSAVFDAVDTVSCSVGLLAVLLYVMLPARLLCQIDSSGTVRGEISGAYVLKNAASCLNYAAEISREVALCDPALADSEGYQAAIERVCRSCPNRELCLGQQYDTTCDCLYKAYLSAAEGEVVFPSHFVCVRKLQLSDAMMQIYLSRLHQKATARAFLGVKEQCAGALSAAGGLLSAIASGEEGSHRVSLPKTALRVARVAASMGYHVDECLAETSEGQGLCITIAVTEMVTPYRAGVLADKLEDVLDTVFSAPDIRRSGGITAIYLCQSVPLTLSVAVQCDALDGVCGDRFAHFCGDDGLTYLLLCDGMGAGAKGAAFGSYTKNFLQKILQGGVPKQAGVDLLSCTLPLGCGMEGLSTIDLAGFNGFTGRLRLTKAGAEQTMVLTGRGTALYGHASTPVGYGTSRLWEGEVALHEGDILLMHSDGIDDNGKLKTILWQNRFKSPDNIAQAVLQSGEKKKDDRTVIVAKVVRGDRQK